MSTSGITTTSPVRDIVTKKALRIIGAYTAFSNPTPQQIKDAIEALNLMIKTWQIQGFMWLQQYATLFLVPGQTSYKFPGANGATEYAETTTTVALVALDTLVGVDDSTGMAVDDIIGIRLDSGSIYWDTISLLVGPGQVTITGSIPSDIAIGASVFAYNLASSLYRPTRLFNVQKVYSGGNEIQLLSMSRDDYSKQPSKTTSGTPTQYYYDPQVSTGKLYLWQTPSNSTDKLVVDMDRPLQVMIDSSNSFDFPEEWIECLAYGLAVRLAPEYAVPLAERRELKSEFSVLAENRMSYNRDWTSTFFGVNHG